MYAKSFHWAVHSHTREQEREKDKRNQPRQCCIKKTCTKASNQQIVLPSSKEREKKSGAEAPEIDHSAMKDEIIRARMWETVREKLEGRDKESEGWQKERGFKMRGRKWVSESAGGQSDER